MCITPCASLTATASCRAIAGRPSARAKAGGCGSITSVIRLDFVLWRPRSRRDRPGRRQGRGQPGWHIECSAMSCHHLGGAFRHHGGGADLQFPHHEQSPKARARARPRLCELLDATMALSRVDDEKCPNRWAISSPSARCWKNSDAEVVRFLFRACLSQPMNYSTHHGRRPQCADPLGTTLKRRAGGRGGHRLGQPVAARFRRR